MAKNATLEKLPQLLGHLLRDDLIGLNPVKVSVCEYVRTSVRTYVRTSTIKHNAATIQTVESVRVDEAFMKILLSRSSQVKVKVT